ncbi:hypothetical protein DN448_04515 [Lactobacillus reuteri]|nr:hypothetical protein [Limosilactobacillus reuteri]
MAKIMNPDQVQKDFFKVIKEINDKQEVILIKSTDPGEKGAVMIGENYWNAIQDVLGNDDGVAHISKNTQEIIDKIFKEDSELLRALKNL